MIKKYKIESEINNLIKNKKSGINSIQGKLKKDFQKIIQILEENFNKEDYFQIIEEIYSFFSDSNDLNPGTIESYFTGCVKDKNSEFICNSEFYNSIYQNNETCKISIFEYENRNMTKMNSEESKNGIVFIKDKNFTKFEPNDILFLKNQSIENVSLIYNTNNYKQQSKFVSIDKIQNQVKSLDISKKDFHLLIPLLTPFIILFIFFIFFQKKF
jgi:hypothetical protein